MSSNFGNKIKIQIFGQSHSEMLGVVMDGLPPGFALDMEKLNLFLKRRQGGNHTYSTPRKEEDIPKILSGIVNGRTCGAPLCAAFENQNTRSGDYAQFLDIPRPSHADYTAHVKYHGANDIRGGGHFSGRLTLPLCFAGGICMQLLEARNIYISAHIFKIADVCDTPFDLVNCTEPVSKDFPVLNTAQGDLMIDRILNAAKDGDSVGGIIECTVIGLPAGVGDPMFDGIENKLSSVIFGIPAVKGIEFGSGFACTGMRGSEHNDPYYFDEQSQSVKTKTNHAGGILGGISTGMPIVFRVAFKPTPSISKEQYSVSLKNNGTVPLKITGRHDPCIVPRAVPCVEAAAALALADLL